MSVLAEQIAAEREAELTALRAEARQILLRVETPKSGDAVRITEIYAAMRRPVHQVSEDAELLKKRMALGDFVQAADDELDRERQERADCREEIKKIEAERLKRNAEWGEKLARLEGQIRHLQGAESRNARAIAAGRKLVGQIGALLGNEPAGFSSLEIERYNARLKAENESRERAEAEAEENRIAGGVPQAEAAFRRRLREDKEHIEREGFKNRTTLGRMADQ